MIVHPFGVKFLLQGEIFFSKFILGTSLISLQIKKLNIGRYLLKKTFRWIVNFLFITRLKTVLVNDTVPLPTESIVFYKHSKEIPRLYKKRNCLNKLRGRQLGAAHYATI